MSKREAAPRLIFRVFAKSAGVLAQVDGWLQKRLVVGGVWRWLRAHHMSVLFYGVLGYLTYLIVIFPLWHGAFLPMSDFGGHLALFDAYIHIDERPLLGSYLEAQSGWYPNVAAVLFCDLLEPVMGLIPSMRLFYTLSVLGTILSLLWFAKVFERSRWQVIACLPLLWGLQMIWGLINFLGVIGLIFGGMCIGRGVSRRPGWWWSLVICGWGLLSFSLHGIGHPFVLFFTSGMLVIYASSPRQFLHILGFVPSLLLWRSWLKASDTGGMSPVSDVSDAFGETSTYFDPKMLVDFYVGDVLNITKEHFDTAILLQLMVILLVWMSINVSGEVQRVWRAPAPDQSTRAWLRALAQGGLLRVRQHSLLLAALIMAAMVYYIPVFIRNTPVSSRLFTPLTMLILFIPRLPKRSLLKALSVAASIYVALNFGRWLDVQFKTYHKTEGAAFLNTIAHIPEGALVACVNHEHSGQIFSRSDMVHNCPGLIQHLRQGFAGIHFAMVPYSPVVYREGVGSFAVPAKNWWKNNKLKRFDYVIARHDGGTSASKLVELVHTEPIHGNSSQWSLYRVIKPQTIPK